MKITGKQIAMARILLDLSQKDLAEKIGIARKTIMRIENGQSPGSTSNLEKIQTFFENNGLEFQDGDGVKRKTGEIITLKGTDGFRQFMDDVYITAKNQGGEFRLHNAKNLNWYKWLGKEWYENHAQRMSTLANINFKITAEEGDQNFIGSAFAEYKWWPKELFDERSFYVLNSKLAFLNFMEDEVEITVLHSAEFSRGFKILFDIAWDRVAIKPPPKN